MQRLVIDEQGTDFRYLGYRMHLTPTELRILRALTEHAVCRADALDAGDAASVSVHVCSINKKAQTIGGRRLICARRGRGYALCDDI